MIVIEDAPRGAGCASACAPRSSAVPAVASAAPACSKVRRRRSLSSAVDWMAISSSRVPRDLRPSVQRLKTAVSLWLRSRRPLLAHIDRVTTRITGETWQRPHRPKAVESVSPELSARFDARGLACKSPTGSDTVARTTDRRKRVAKFVIAPHMRLHEWIARDKGYFDHEGLEYELSDELISASGKLHDLGDKVGAYQTFERGRSSNINCACHWTINVAASVGHGKLYPHAYSVAPSGVFVPPESEITHPSQLAGVPVSVGYQSGSHYATIQALEQYLRPEEIELSFADGLLFRRMELLIDRQVPAASVFSGPYYFLEQLGFRKVIR